MLLSRTLVLLTYLHQVFYLISAAKFVHHLAKTKKPHSFSSASLFLFNVSILCFCTILSSRTVRTNSLPDLILISVFNPRDLYYRGYKKGIIIIIIWSIYYTHRPSVSSVPRKEDEEHLVNVKALVRIIFIKDHVTIYDVRYVTTQFQFPDVPLLPPASKSLRYSFL